MSTSEHGSWLQRWFPGVAALVGYQRRDFRGDLVSAVLMGLVTIPSAIAYADLAGTTPIAGLYAALAGLITYALFGSSRHVQCGPDSSVALVAGSIVIPLAAGDPDKAFKESRGSGKQRITLGPVRQAIV